MLKEGYGSAFLDMMASVYPGYKASGTAENLVIGCFYAATDGIIAGGGFILLYNHASCCGKRNKYPFLIWYFCIFHYIESIYFRRRGI